MARGGERGRRSSSRNLRPRKDSCTSSSFGATRKIAKSLGTRSSGRLASRCKKVQCVEQSSKEGSLDESSSSSHLNEVNNHVQPLDESENTKLAVYSRCFLKSASRCEEGRLGELHSRSGEDDKALDEYSLILQYVDFLRAADESGCQAAAINVPVPCASTSRAAVDCDKNKSVAAEAPPTAQKCALEDSRHEHLSREIHSAAPSSSPAPIAHVIKAANMGVPTPSSAAVGSFLTDMVNRFQYDSSDEAEVGSAPPLVKVHDYNVKEASADILGDIIHKYGDIAANCSLTSAEYRSCLLERVCDIVQELQKKEFNYLSQECIKKHIDNVADLKKIDIDVEWLSGRLEGIYNAKLLIKDMRALKKGKNRLIQERDEAEAEIERMNKSVVQAKAKLRYAEAEIERINRSALEAKPMVLLYAKEGSMVDGLL